MQNTIENNAGAVRAFSGCTPQSAGNLLRVVGGKSFTDVLAEKRMKLFCSAASNIVKTKKFMPDGSIVITTRKDGKVVDRTTKKPHLVPVPDPTAEGGVRMEPQLDIFEMLMGM